MFFFLEYKLLLLVGAGVVGLVAALHRRSLRSRESQLDRDVAALGRLLPGGTPESALVVSTSALLETRATSQPCPACGGPDMKVLHHTAEEHGGERLRVIRVGCDGCGAARPVYVKIVARA